MKIKFLTGIIILSSLWLNTNGQISLAKISWSGDKKEMILDSVLTIPINELLLPTIQSMENALQDLPVYMYESGLNAKVYILYNNEIAIKNSPRIRGLKEFDEALSNISDIILNTILPYLKLDSNIIYMLSVIIAYDIKIEEEKGIQYSIQYEKEKEQLGKKENNVITIIGNPKR